MQRSGDRGRETYSSPASVFRGALKYIATALGRTRQVRTNASVSTRLDHSIEIPSIHSFEETDSSPGRAVKLWETSANSVSACDAR